MSRTNLTPKTTEIKTLYQVRLRRLPLAQLSFWFMSHHLTFLVQVDFP